MANYDKDTEKFIRDTVPDDAIRVGLGVAGRALPAARPVTFAAERYIREKSAAAPSTVLNLYELMNSKLPGWQDWEPETLRKELFEEGVNITEEIRNVVGALQVVANTNYPFELWHVFENTAHAFAGNDVNFSIIQPLELTEIAAAMKILKAIRPKEGFEDEVLGYVAAVAKQSGVVYLPRDMFDESQKFLDELNNDLELKERTRVMYPAMKEGDDALAIQTQRLAEVREYANG